MTACPICRDSDTLPMLSLKHQPVYQHPVADPGMIAPPYFKNLGFEFCRTCSHGFQKDFDLDLLRRIYTQYYYTPRPPGIGTRMQETFMAAITQNFHLDFDRCRMLEIGCSSGEVLVRMGQHYRDVECVGFEPSRVSAQKARALGITVVENFFSAQSTASIDQPFDLIFHRHVIEHVADPEDFFAVHNRVCHDYSILVVETPCLDEVAATVSLAPFHIEHIHLFSKQSLSTLLARYGWFLKGCKRTDAQNMITWFDRKGPAIPVQGISGTPDFSEWIRQNQMRIDKAVENRKLALWGAGSGGIKIVNHFGLTPEVIIDSNPLKKGMGFPGFKKLTIAYAPDWLDKELAHSRSWLILIASTYYQEIQAQLDALGWQGKIISPYQVTDPQPGGSI
ncbi:MAG: methyltransferase domain-containing protein [Desulfobacteraceae bacterium]|nr:MAG: methyltransferase domain-containing protein [Desulfobacteraceae bacterium]